MGCCDKMFKYVIFLFNFVFFLTSVALIGIGAYIQVHMSKYLDFLGNTYLNTSIMLIIIGVVMMIVTFFGCCGACTESHCMMYTYGTLLALILLSLIGVAITIYVFKDDVREVVSNGMKQGLQEYKKKDHDGVTQTWDIMQSDFKCCGVDSYKDWTTTEFGASGDVPDFCCIVNDAGCGKGKGNLPADAAGNVIYTTGCFSAFEGLIQSNVSAAAGVGVGVAVLLFLGVLISCCVAKNMRQENSYV